MAFNSLEYGIFLVVVFLFYWLLARTGTLRIVFLLVASWVFYAASNPYFLFLIIGSTVTDYVAGWQMTRHDDRPGYRRLWLIISLIVNLGLLGVFKYSNFFYESFVNVANTMGADLTFTRLDILLPAGISFYTFQTMSYSIDVYRRKCPAELNFTRFAFFVGYFPQLVAGPIVRAVDFLPQIGKRPYFTTQQASRALWLIAIGLFKKVAIADYLGVNLVERAFDTPDVLSSMDVLLGLYGYTMQMYMDFSAYTDIAIGSALLFGFHLPDNFDRPYKATSVQDFWRRWHKTLGSWLRDYLYYPLGGGQVSPLKVYRNLFITFLLIGLWHGADWTYVIYGALHASAMIINRMLRKRRDRLGIKLKLDWWGVSWRVFLTLHFVMFARILFRAGIEAQKPGGDPFGKVDAVLSALGQGTYDSVTVMTPLLWALLIGSYLWHWTPRAWTEATFTGFRRMPAYAQGVLVGVALLLVALIASGRPIPFQYFRF
ncbi:MAG: MBOAT family protein [Deltaproteobacteria bacterium]|nr:MAG: MBOAT family protein [Deltaproteobacteria bacterium]